MGRAGFHCCGFLWNLPSIAPLYTSSIFQKRKVDPLFSSFFGYNIHQFLSFDLFFTILQSTVTKITCLDSESRTPSRLLPWKRWVFLFFAASVFSPLLPFSWIIESKFKNASFLGFVFQDSKCKVTTFESCQFFIYVCFQFYSWFICHNWVKTRFPRVEPCDPVILLWKGNQCKV